MVSPLPQSADPIGEILSTSANKNILLGVSGGIAAFKAVLFLRLATRAGANVRVVMTPAATKFVTPLTFEALSGHPVEVDIWSSTKAGGESHVRLAEWADAVVIVPATANFLAEQVQGLCRDLLGALCLATSAPIIVAPAMHENMWLKPAVQRTVRQLAEDGYTIVGPVTGDLAAGSGQGRMAEPEVIFAETVAALTPQDLAGRHVLVTAGPTREALDPVRFLSNHSSGRMGYCVGEAAAARGAKVTLVSGPTALPAPRGCDVVSISSAADMYHAVLPLFGDCDVAVMAAAVADYTIAEPASHKLKKTEGTFDLALVRTVDILSQLGKKRRNQVLVGFAMETEDLVARAQSKLERKGCDIMVANSLSEPGAGFGHTTNRVTLLQTGQQPEALPLMDKIDVAHQILDRIVGLLRANQ